MEAFWKAWAAHEARNQWLIYYRDKAENAPEVETVTVLTDPPVMRVQFMDGTLLDMVPTGLAKPPRLPVGGTR